VVNTSFKVSNLEQQGALLNMPHSQPIEHENTYSYSNVRVQSTPPVFNITPSLMFHIGPSKNPDNHQMDGKFGPRQTSVLRMLARFDSFGKFVSIQTVLNTYLGSISSK